jgi:hypothetical protein
MTSSLIQVEFDSAIANIFQERKPAILSSVNLKQVVQLTKKAAVQKPQPFIFSFKNLLIM